VIVRMMTVMVELELLMEVWLFVCEVWSSGVYVRVEGRVVGCGCEREGSDG
jgi:hypothetical protein